MQERVSCATFSNNQPKGSMIHVIVHGFRKFTKTRQCCIDLRKAVELATRVPVYRIAVSFPSDLCTWGLGVELFAYVYGLDTASHTPLDREEKESLCSSIFEILKIHKPGNCRHIQVRTCSYDMKKEGYGEGRVD